jgi:hypothetical protein
MSLTDHADYKLVLNFPLLGKILPHKIKDIIKAAKENNYLIIDRELFIAGEKLPKETYSLNLVIKEKYRHENVKKLPNPSRPNAYVVNMFFTITKELIKELIKDWFSHELWYPSWLKRPGEQIMVWLLVDKKRKCNFIDKYATNIIGNNSKQNSYNLFVPEYIVNLNIEDSPVTIGIAREEVAKRQNEIARGRYNFFRTTEI